MVQQEKEALDDLSTDLELADEDDPVLYVVFIASFFVLFTQLIKLPATRSAKHFFTSPYHAP